MKTCHLCGTEFDTQEKLADHHRQMHTQAALVSDTDNAEREQDVGQKTIPERHQ